MASETAVRAAASRVLVRSMVVPSQTFVGSSLRAAWAHASTVEFQGGNQASFPAMKRLLIVWHSRTGAARAMAEAAAMGAGAEPDVEVRVLAADAAEADDLLTADGYLFACPENLAAMSGAMKEFFDRNYYPA